MATIEYMYIDVEHWETQNENKGNMKKTVFYQMIKRTLFSNLNTNRNLINRNCSGLKMCLYFLLHVGWAA